MRVLFNNCAIAIKCAFCDGKKLTLMTLDGEEYCAYYRTGDIALHTLHELIIHGYIAVNKLYKEDND